MPPNSLVTVLALLLFGVSAGMFTALGWVLHRVLTGQSILPPWPEPPKLVPWGGLTVIAVVITWIVVNVSVSAAYLQVRSALLIQDAGKPTVALIEAGPILKVPLPEKAVKPDPIFNFTEQMVLISVINGVLLAVLPIGIRLTSSDDWKDLGLSAGDFQRNVIMGVIAFLLITPVVMGINGLAQWIWSPNRHPLERMLREEASPAMIVLAYVSAVLLAPAAEELIFRGVIQGWLRRVFSMERPQTAPSRQVERNPRS